MLTNRHIRYNRSPNSKHAYVLIQFKQTCQDQAYVSVLIGFEFVLFVLIINYQILPMNSFNCSLQI